MQHVKLAQQVQGELGMLHGAQLSVPEYQVTATSCVMHRTQW